MKGWREHKLAEITTLIGDGLHGTPNYDTSGKYFFVNGNNLMQGRIIIKPDTQRVTKEEGLKYKKPLSEKTILLSINGTIGNLAYYRNEKCMLGKSACFINLNDKVDTKFAYYTFLARDFQNYIREIATGTTIPNVPLKGLREYVLRLPPLPEQKAIAEVLSSLDDKIDLLHRQNKTLEQLAETLFRQWFVEEAEEGWEVGKLGDEFIFIMGQSPPGSALNEDGDGMVFYQGRTDFGFRFPEPRVYTTESTRMANKGDTLISVRAPIGDINMAMDECCLGRGVAAFRYKVNVKFTSYTYYKMKSLATFFKQFEDSGTVFGSIGKEDFSALEIIIPPDSIVESFQSKIENLDLKIQKNTIQINNLTKLRDTLLPKLMNGEVRVEKIGE